MKPSLFREAQEALANKDVDTLTAILLLDAEYVVVPDPAHAEQEVKDANAQRSVRISTEREAARGLRGKVYKLLRVGTV